MRIGPIQPFLPLVALAAACSGRAGTGADAGPAIWPLPAPWMAAIPQQGVPRGLKGIRAQDCAECHRANYDEWRTSAHAEAWVDPQFQAEMKKDSLWACAMCHTPIVNQLPRVVTGLVGGDLRAPVETENPRFDPTLQAEGLTCATCHVRDGAIVGPRDVQAPHPMRVDPGALSLPLCERCHNAQVQFSKQVVCGFDTVDDWRGTDLPRAGTECKSCHMPEVMRQLADGKTKLGRFHTFAGAGVPKRADVEATGGRSGLTVELEPQPLAYRRGAVQPVRVTVTNSFAGHRVPTGDMERFALLRFRLLDEAGRVRWSRDERMGQSWEWWPEAKKLGDNRLRRGEKRTLSLAVDIPRGMKAASLEVTLENHRITEQNASWMHLPDDYPKQALAWRQEFPLPLRP